MCWLLDLTRLLGQFEAGKPVFDDQDLRVVGRVDRVRQRLILIGNKVDLVPREQTLPLIAAAQEQFGDALFVPLSARTGENVSGLMKELWGALPPGPAMYPEEEWTQVTERFLVSEVIRHQLYKLLSKELPYCATVEIVQFDEKQREQKGLVRVYAQIIVERGSQKGIVIGKGGTMLKKIGTLARREIEELLECRVYLDLLVKVEKDWTRTRSGLGRAGFLQS